MEEFERLIVTVSQLNHYLKGLFDEIPAFGNVYVSGEISNFTNHYRTGHFYFSLKDDKSLVKAVMFHSYASRLKFLPQNGMQVLVKARLSVFERDGVYQLYVEDMQPKGAGGLSLAYEQLKEKLSKEGLFDAKFKKPLPHYPERIGVITSSTGAAIRDIRNILSRRYPVAQMILEPVLVQGDGAPEQLVNALRRFGKEKNCDVIIIGRGGGSIEDLWAFNDEMLAREIFACEIPVISAVGHETDFTIADFVADLRAPTPSAAAELAVPNLSEVYNEITSAHTALRRLIQSRVNEKRLVLEQFKAKPCMKNAGYVIDENRMKLHVIEQQLLYLISAKLDAESARLNADCSKLDALSPLKVLSRGFSLVKNDNGIVTAASQIAIGDSLNIMFAKGSATVQVQAKEEKGK